MAKSNNRVEQYIQCYTKHCSNEVEIPIDSVEGWHYVPWLTIDNARAIADIAREEALEEVKSEVCRIRESIKQTDEASLQRKFAYDIVIDTIKLLMEEK